MWKASLHYLQNWQKDVAFSYGNLAVETLSKIVSTTQDSANAVNANTCATHSIARSLLRQRVRPSLNAARLKNKVTDVQEETIPNICYGTIFGDVN